MMEQLLALAEHFSLTVVEMEPIGNQFWAHVLACIKMPAGGINGRGSMHCSFSMDVPNESIVKFLMEDITFKPNERCACPHLPARPRLPARPCVDGNVVTRFYGGVESAPGRTARRGTPEGCVGAWSHRPPPLRSADSPPSLPSRVAHVAHPKVVPIRATDP